MRRRRVLTSVLITSTPSMRISPLVGSTRRLTIFRLVVLPQPLGPTSTQMSPAGTSSDRSTTAPCGPYFLLTWRNSTVALVMAGALQRGRVSPVDCPAGPTDRPIEDHRCTTGG